jgi:succinoglycan biosynthesis protein ExoA
MSGLPDVSVLLPVRNEAAHIDDALHDLLNQDFEGVVEVIVADGQSSDATATKVALWASEDPRVHLVTNEERFQAPGLNLAARVARAGILIRADGHTRYANDFVARSVAAFSEVGGAVGGPMNPVGSNSFGRAVAAAMNSPLTMGPGRFHHAKEREEVDTVYLGCFAKADFEAVGGFRHFPSGSSEDADFYYRWRKSGRKVHVDPAIRSMYTPRSTFKGLLKQYWKYGQGKAEMLWANGRLPSWRPMAPVGLVLGILIGVLLWAVGGPGWPLMLLGAPWFALLGWVGWRSGEKVGSVMVAAATMHLAYGLGAVYGLIRGPRRRGGYLQPSR